MSLLRLAMAVSSQDRRQQELARRESGVILWPKIGGGQHNRIFDLYDVAAAKCKVRGDTDDKLVAIAGVWVAVAAGAAGKALDEEITLTASSYLYLLVDREDNAATLEVGAVADGKPDGDDDEEVFLLWYVPFADGKITADSILDLRDTKHWVAGA